MAKRPARDEIDAIHFEGIEALRAWFDANHATATELWLLHYKAATGKRTITWSQSVDEALAVGWIDSVIQPLDAHRYAQRFSPRRPGSTWSVINVAKAEALVAAGRMRPAGLAAFDARQAARTGIYSHERALAAFEPAQEKAFRAKKRAWAFFEAQAPSYRRTAIHWVTSAKAAATRASRLATLVALRGGPASPAVRTPSPPRLTSRRRGGSRDHASANSTTTLMSSGPRVSASAMWSGGTRREIKRASQSRSAAASAWAAR